MSNYTTLKNCLACGGEDLFCYLDLGNQPLANSYLHDLCQAEETFPLAVNVCTKCFHNQLTVAVAPDLLYKHYLYVSGTSKTLTDYFDWFVGFVEEKYPSKSLRVLDIASNDGTLLSRFGGRHQVVGVDPAENLLSLSKEKSVPTICAYWSDEIADRLVSAYGYQDVVVAQNVLAHNPDPIGFLKAAKKVLAKDGTIFIQTSQSEMFRRKEFDTIYHEHHSFFSISSFIALVKSVGGLKISKVNKVPVHGTSYLVSIQHDDTGGFWSLDDEYAEESDMYHLSYFKEYSQFVKDTVEKTKQKINMYRSLGYTVCGYGAAAKGNTFLNFSEIDLDFIVDDNPMKWGLYAPGCHIPIASPEKLCVEKPLVALIMAWNFKDEIKAKIKKVRTSGETVVVTYYPDLIEEYL